MRLEVSSKKTRLPIGRRILEIFKEKGDAFSLTAVSDRIGMTRQTLAKKLNGEQELYPFEFDKIVVSLKMPVERITQKDTEQKEDELLELLETLSLEKDRMLELAGELCEVAIGHTEKAVMQNYLGRVHYHFKHYEEAKNCWCNAYQMAVAARRKQDDSSQLLWTIVQNLMMCYSSTQDLLSLHELLRNVEPAFEAETERFATIYNSQARIDYRVGNLEMALQKLYKVLELYQKTEVDFQIGVAEHNVAHLEYELGHFEQAKTYFFRAMRTLEPYHERNLISKKDYAKLLLKLLEREEALSIIEDGLRTSCQLGLVELEGSFLILQSMAECQTDSANHVFENHKFGPRLRFLACKCLMEHYRRLGDGNSFMRYYEIAEELKNESHEKWDEEV